MTFIDVTARESITIVSGQARTFERTYRVIAFGISVARISKTFVQICAEKSIAGKAIIAFTVVATGRIRTSRFICTSVHSQAFIDISTCESVAIKTTFTSTCVTAIGVNADCIAVTRV